MAKFNYDKDHPKVQNLKKVVNELRKKRSKTFSGKILKKIGLIKKMTDEDAKNFADKLETRASKLKTATEGSFKSGGIGMLSPKQKKIASKAPPRNKIDGKDFAVLRAEKAKGRGKGLQDEKMKPGKIMKADKGGMGEATKYKKYLKGLKKATDKSKLQNLGKSFFKSVGVFPVVSPPQTAKKSMKKIGSTFLERRAKLAGTTVKGIERAAKATKYGKIAAGVAGAALLAKAGLEKLYEKRTGKRAPTKRPLKKMGGGMMMKKPMMAKEGKITDLDRTTGNILMRQFIRDKKRISPKGITKAKREAAKAMGGYMGGGMMQRPMMAMGYDTGDLASAENVYKKIKAKDRKKATREALERMEEKRKKRKKDPRDPIGPGPLGSIPGGLGGRGISNVPGRLRRQPVIPTPKLAVPQMSKGSSVKVKVKLGRNKPTKLF